MPSKKPMKEKTDKRRRAKITVGHDMYGEPIVKYASGRTKQELEDHKKELIRTYRGGAIAVDRERTFGEYALEWYIVYKKPNVSPSSQKNYESALNNHLIPEFGDRQLRAIRNAELQYFMNSKAGMGKTAIGDMHSILINVFSKAYSEGVIDFNPSAGLKKPKVTTETRRALTDQEVAAALHVIDTHPHGFLLCLLYYTGVRRGEALGLQWQDIDFKDKELSVERDVDFTTNDIGEVKTAASVRMVPIPDALGEALEARRGIGEAYLIQSPRSLSHLGSSTYDRWWEKLQIAMLEADPSIEKDEVKSSKMARKKDEDLEPVYGSALTAHYFRHNYASQLYNAGVDVLIAQSILGHRDARTTLSIYTHFSEHKRKIETEKLSAVFAAVAKRLPDSPGKIIGMNSKSPQR